ncbi:thiamine pyrophosphate-dependent enzyme [Microvirga yunnanensis]|uniref:thiamine pyrophosphate-dependent enzyme n=1 Tax=Microvirga yunnanensis TaxID=2953740 RepID=UPI0021CA15B0|nr:thiamine pyrophosphate-dependent enzyme [Microvirga sp. HBU65207]
MAQLQRNIGREELSNRLPLPEGISAQAMLDLYRSMVLLRKFELAAQVACRTGETPGFLHLYVGQEATASGICAHLRPTDWITSTHRGHGHALAKGMDPSVLMAELYGKHDGCCGGRGGTMHLYDPAIGLFGTNGLVGGGIPSAVGAAISAKYRGTRDVSVAFFGDGATNHAAFHEALNFAGVRRAPVVLVCENNLYATATALSSVTLNPEIASRAAAYGIPGIAVDGNDVIAVWQAARDAVERARNGHGPTLIEAKTYRTVGHHEGDPVIGIYRTQEEVDEWTRRCPVETFRRRIVEDYAIVTGRELDRIDASVDASVKAAIEYARRSPAPEPETYSLHVFADPINPTEATAAMPRGRPTVETGWLDAVRDGIAEEMRRNRDLIYFGEGTGERGGTFAHTKGLYQEFGGDRMVDTPISELGFTGAALGASATGTRCIADLMFADFLFEAAGQIVLQAAKLRYMSNGQMQAPMVVRVGAGAVRSAGPHHSGTYHPVWAHVPGLVVCLPSTPADAKGLMKTALRARDPVIMLETKALFSSKGPVPQGEHFVPFGLARIARKGTDLTIASAGQLVIKSLEAADILAEDGISVEVIDLRTIQPLDVETVADSVRRTHRLLVVDEAYAMFGVGAELGQSMNELCFDHLDAPVARLHTAPVTHPFAPSLEGAMLVSTDRIVAAARRLLRGEVDPIDRAGRFAAAGRGAAEEVDNLPVRQTRPHVEAVAPMRGSIEGIPITMPFGDLTVNEGKLVKWYRRLGDSVAQGDHVADIETDKAVVEIESPASGVLAEILAADGATVAMGSPIGIVREAS